jgi:hypothetical protein
MKIGILVNTDRHLDAIVGLTRAARERGHEIVIFAMDDGTRLLAEPSYTALSASPGVTMSFCDHSAEKLSLDTGGIGKEIRGGSQYDNASMMHEADRVIIL